MQLAIAERKMLKRRLVVLCGAALMVCAPVVNAQIDDGLGPEMVCLIEPYVVVEVSSSIPGVLAQVNVDRGDFVQQGQTLAELESHVQEADVILARARVDMDDEIHDRQTRLEFARRKQARAEDLFRKKMISGEEKDQLDTDLVLAQSQLNIAQTNKRLAVLELQRAIEALKMRTIDSPIDGVVVERFLSPGESAEDRPILKLAKLDPLHVEVVLPVADLGSIRPGIYAEVIPDDPAAGAHTAEVVVVDRVVDAASGTVGVRLRLPNPGNRIRAGTKCELGELSAEPRRAAAAARQRAPETVAAPAESATRSSDSGVVLAASSRASSKPDVTGSDSTAGWIKAYDPQHYTLQLISSSDEETAKRFLASIAGLGGDNGYVRYEAKGAMRYAVLHGVYASRSEAEQASAQLPVALRKNKPWTRKIGDLLRLVLP